MLSYAKNLGWQLETETIHNVAGQYSRHVNLHRRRPRLLTNLLFKTISVNRLTLWLCINLRHGFRNKKAPFTEP
jgi:hypothetical protein